MTVTPNVTTTAKWIWWFLGFLGNVYSSSPQATLAAHHCLTTEPFACHFYAFSHGSLLKFFKDNGLLHIFICKHLLKHVAYALMGKANPWKIGSLKVGISLYGVTTLCPLYAPCSTAWRTTFIQKSWRRLCIPRSWCPAAQFQKTRKHSTDSFPFSIPFCCKRTKTFWYASGLWNINAWSIY